MTKVEVSVEEIIATLVHSNVPTLVCEGKGDLLLLRRMEDAFASVGLVTIAVGGRNKVLEIFDRRNELPPNQAYLFFVDRDCWVYGNVPQNCLDHDLLYTDGYSIENDMYRDGNLEEILSLAESVTFSGELQRFLTWYSVAIDRHLNNAEFPITTSPDVILDEVDDLDSYLNMANGENFPGSLYDELCVNYARILRGKSLLRLLLRQLTAPGRAAKYNSNNLLELGAIKSGFFSTRVSDWISNRLTEKGHLV